MTSGSPDTTLQHLKSPAGHCSKVCFHLGSEANLMCFKVTLHLLGGSQYMGNMLTYKMNRRTVETWNILILLGTKKQQTFLRSQTWNDLALWNARIFPSIAPLVKLQQDTLTSRLKPDRLIGIPITRNSTVSAAEVPKDSPIANHEELEEFPQKKLHRWESRKSPFRVSLSFLDTNYNQHNQFFISIFS